MISTEKAIAVADQARAMLLQLDGDELVVLARLADSMLGIRCASLEPTNGSIVDGVRARLVLLDNAEVMIFAKLARRLVEGREAYGPLVLDTDERDFDAQRDEEDLDGLNYSAMADEKDCRKGRIGARTLHPVSSAIIQALKARAEHWR